MSRVSTQDSPSLQIFNHDDTSKNSVAFVGDLQFHHDLTVLAPHSFRHAPSELGLSHEQDSLFRIAIAAQRTSVERAHHDYRAARLELFDTLNTGLHDIHDAMRSGSLTHEQGRDSMHVLVQAY